MIVTGPSFQEDATPTRSRHNIRTRWSPSAASGWAILIFGLALAIRWIRIHAGPDVFSDELEYASIARHLAATGRIDDFLGGHQLGIFFTHPPAYFVVAAIFEKITWGADPRYLCGLIGAVTAVQLYYLGQEMRGVRVGVIAGLYFAFSPIAVRIDRMGMIEALGTALTVAFIQVIWRGIEGRRWVLAGGIVLAMLFLTKELLIFMVPLLLASAVLYRKQLPARKVAAVIAFGAACWAIYALCCTVIDASLFWSVGTESIRRALGEQVTTGYALPRYPSPYGDIKTRAWEIAPDVLMGVIALVGCLARLRLKDNSRPERLALIWLLSVGGFLLAAHIYNFQFIVYLVPPVVIGGALTLGSIIGDRQAYRTWLTRAWVAILVVAAAATAVIYRYGFTTDMALTETATWVNKNLPAHTLLYAPVEFNWLSPQDGVVNPYYFPSLESTKKLDIHWVIISPRTSYMLDPQTLRYITDHGHVARRFYGATLREVDVIYLKTPLGH